MKTKHARLSYEKDVIKAWLVKREAGGPRSTTPKYAFERTQAGELQFVEVECEEKKMEDLVAIAELLIRDDRGDVVYDDDENEIAKITVSSL